MRKDVYLLITRENTYFLKVLPCFISFQEYGENEKKKYPNDVGKIETHLCVFRICYYNNIHFNEPEKEKMNCTYNFCNEKLERAEANIPWHPAHYICPNCDSTYVL